jgi:transposase
MRVRDSLGAVFSDAEFAGLFARRGHPALSPAFLTMVSVLQYAEGLTDRQAADAVRGRLDWKYCLVRHEAPLFRAGMEGPRGWPVAAGQ